jgi:hypothetical protein
MKLVLTTSILVSIVHIVLSLNQGIILDGWYGTKGGAQLLVPGTPSYVSNVNYSLPHRQGCATVVTDRGIFIIGGGRLNELANSVTEVNVFNPTSENTHSVASMLTARSEHAAVATTGV